MSTPTNPMDILRKAVGSGEVTYFEVATRSGVHFSTVHRALAGKIDTPESTQRKYMLALADIRADRKKKGGKT